MKPLAAHASPTVAATLAAATISLSIFLLPGAGIRSGPTPLLTGLGATAGRVAGDLPAVAVRASKPARHAAAAPALAGTPAKHVVPQRQTAAPGAQRVHRRTRARVVPPAASTSATAPTPATPAQPAARFFSAPRAPRGKSHGRAHAARPAAAATTPRVRGHGKGFGPSTPRGQGVGRGRGNAPAAPPAPPAPGKSAGNGPERGKR